MVLFNYAIREVTAKLVYYGPGLCGKTTNLQFIHEKLDPSARGKLLSLATDGDRTLFFDFLPIEMGSIGGYKVRFQLYTVPGQVHYNATRKLVLKGVDAVAFVADSQLSMVERNRESFENLIENLIENGYDPAKVPIVIQLNKRDLPTAASVGELMAAMRVEDYPMVEAVASRGDGVFETLKTIVKLTLSRLRTQFDATASGGTEQREAPAPMASPPPPPPPSAVFAPAAPPPPQPAPPQPPPPPPPPRAPAPPPPAAVAAPPAAPPPPPRPPEVEVSAPTVPVEAFDEFDLEDFSDEPAGPAVVDSPNAAYGEIVPEDPDVLELEDEMESFMGGQELGEESVFDTAVDHEAVAAVDLAEGFAEAGPEPAGEDDWLVETPPDIAPARAVGADTGELPPWAVELAEGVRRLRAENVGLRAALRGITALLDRQIAVLQEGREELDRHVADTPGESGT